MSSVLAQVVQILEEASQADPGSVNGDTVLSTLDGWDSMGVVFFLGEVANHWPSVWLSGDAIEACTTVGDLARLTESGL
jgi:acyl carrier protein